MGLFRRDYEIVKRYTENFGIFSAFLFLTVLSVYLYSPVIESHADSDAQVNISVNVGSIISFTADPSLDVDVRPNNFAQGTINASVSTNSPYGYTISLEDSDSNTSMTHVDTNISDVVLSDFSEAKTSNAMDNNTWGYSLDGLEFYSVPANGNPATIARLTSSMNSSSDDLSLTLGFKIGSITSGLYSDTLVFTAYANGIDDVVVKTGATTINELNNTPGQTELAADDPDGNIRYVGANPHNYVSFNDELWRIVGVFDGRMKIVRVESLGQFSFDSSVESFNMGYGINDYSKSKLMQELNGDYLNTALDEDVAWYIREYLSTTDWDGNPTYFDHTKILKSSAQAMIDDAVWYLGSPLNNNGSEIIGWTEEGAALLTPEFIYEQERSNNLGNICHDTSNPACDQTERSATWTGKVGLLYSSDQVYSVGGSNRLECLSKLNTISGYPIECYYDQWLYDINGSGTETPEDILGWFISPAASETYNYSVINHTYHGPAYSDNAACAMDVHPSVYLKEGVYFDGGTGAINDPYILKI